MSLKDVLEDHVAHTLNVGTDVELLQHRQHMCIRRKAVWKTAVRCLKKENFTYDRGLSIRFVGEEAVDVGGPMREFFCLLMKEVGSKGMLMCGDENRRTAVHNALALEQKEYLYVGQSIALSIVYGGPGPHFFSETAANYLLGIPITSIPTEDIPDPEVAKKVGKVRIIQWNRSNAATLGICLLWDHSKWPEYRGGHISGVQIRGAPLHCHGNNDLCSSTSVTAQNP